MENKVIKTIKSRTSTRSYLPKNVPLKKLEAILECGKMAPSGKNRQICNILAIRKKSLLNSLKALGQEAMGRECYYGAPVVILVYGPKEDPFTKVDAACILENMFIATESLGLGSCWINQSEELLSSHKGLKLRKKLGIGEDELIVGSCIVGYKDKETPVKPRREDLVKIL